MKIPVVVVPSPLRRRHHCHIPPTSHPALASPSPAPPGMTRHDPPPACALLSPRKPPSSPRHIWGPCSIHYRSHLIPHLVQVLNHAQPPAQMGHARAPHSHLPSALSCPSTPDARSAGSCLADAAWRRPGTCTRRLRGCALGPSSPSYRFFMPPSPAPRAGGFSHCSFASGGSPLSPAAVPSVAATRMTVPSG